MKINWKRVWCGVERWRSIKGWWDWVQERDEIQRLVNAELRKKGARKK